MDCDNYAYLGQNNDPTGFTNNWLEARSNTKLFSQKYSDYQLYEEPKGRENTSYRSILGNMFTRSVLSDMYFSDKNLRHVKKILCETIRQQSGGAYNITPESQSDNNVLTVMRYMYIEHAKHWEHSYVEQIAELNLKVLTDMVPRMMAKISQELSYQRDHSHQHYTVPRAENVSSAGTRSNRSVSSFFI